MGRGWAVRLSAGRHTIRSLTIGVAISAGILALPGGFREVAVVLSLPCLALFTAWRLLVGGHRRLAAIGFWSLAIAANGLFAALCVSGNVVGIFIPFMVICNHAHARRVRGHMGCTGDAESGSGTSLTTVGLDMGHCPGSDARSDCLDCLAVSSGIPDRQTFPGAASGSDCSRAGRLVSSKCGPVPVSRLKGRFPFKCTWVD